MAVQRGDVSDVRAASEDGVTRPEVVVVGAINVDLVVAAPQLPGPGETVVGRGLERHGGGKGANAAVAAARAGASVRLVGAVGVDDHGVSTLEELRAEGINVEDVAVLAGEATGVALIVVAPDGENQIAVGAGANSAVTPEHVRQALQHALPTAGCVLVSTEIPGDAVRAAVEAASAAGVACLLNPAPVIPEVVKLLEAGPLLTPNASESEDLVRMLTGSQPVAGGTSDDAGERLRARGAAARLVMDSTGAPVVVTLGSEGALVLTPDGAVEHVPPRPTQVRDTTGAGDTFNGVLATRVAAGDPLRDAVELATAAAGLSVAHVGARDGMPTAAAVRASLQST